MDFQESKETNVRTTGMQYLILSVFFAMLSFFIILNVISTTNTEKSNKVASALSQEFKDKDLKKELILFKNETASKQNTEYERDFRQVINEFLSSVKDTIDFQYFENPSHYIVKIKIISIFGPNSNEARANAVTFINYLNRYINDVKKKEGSMANLILLYNPEEPNAEQNAKEKISNLYKNLDGTADKRSINFSIAPFAIKSDKDKEKLDNIYLNFSRYDF